MVDTQRDRLKDIPRLKWPEVDRVDVSYEPEYDSLFVLFVKNRPALAIDADRDLMVRVDPESGEVIGLEIEDFQEFFVSAHPEIDLLWQEAKPRVSEFAAQGEPKAADPSLALAHRLASLARELIGAVPGR